MLIKEKDSIKEKLEQLEAIQNLPNLSKEQLAKVEKEVKCLRSGDKGEEDSAYFIDFNYRDSSNWAIIHDLRLEHNHYVAQIDHLLINRFLEFYVLESKNYRNGIKVTDRGEFLVWFQQRYLSIESPIEQNQRHIKVLKDFLTANELLPKRLGLSLSPGFFSYILVSPKSRVIRPQSSDFNTDSLVKADQFSKQLQDKLNNESILGAIGSVAKMISSESLRQLSERLASYHKPLQVDYYDRFGIPKVTEQKQQPPRPKRKQDTNADQANTDQGNTDQAESQYYCYSCKKTISEKVALFCFGNKNRFKGKAYCFQCQKLIN